MNASSSIVRLLAIAVLAGSFLVPASASVLHENIRFTQLTLDGGLSQAHVTSILQDQRGFIWLGTEDGLNRYDGRTVTVYKHESQDASSLGHSWVGALLEGADGTIWIGTNGAGLDRWQPANDDFEHINSSENEIGPHVRALLEDRTGNLWIGTETGLFRRNPDSGAIDSGTPSGALIDDRINTIFEDSSGDIWIGTTGGGLNRYRPSDKSFLSFRHNETDPTSLPADDVRAVLERRDGSVWVGTDGGGAAKFDRRTETFDRFAPSENRADALSNPRVRALMEDAKGDFWIATDDGLNRLVSEQTKTFRVLKGSPADPRSLSDNRTRALIQDRGGVVWVGTQAGGANRFNPEVGYFPHYRRSSNSPTALSNNSITSFYEETDTTLWVGTMGGGLNRVDLETARVEQVRQGQSQLSDDRIMALEPDGRGGLWIGTFGKGLDHYDPETGKFTNYSNSEGQPNSLSARGVMSLHLTTEGQLWVGTFGGGLNKLESDGTFTIYAPVDGDESAISDSDVTVIEEDTDGALWVGTRVGGLNRFDPTTGTATSFRHAADDPSSLASDVVTSLLLDSAKRLWIGTEEGLQSWSAEDRAAGRLEFDRYSESNGLPNQRVWGILEDAQREIWASTNRGLARLNPNTTGIRSYDESRGLQSNEFNFGASHRGASGRLYFGGINGFNAFQLDDIRNNLHIPPVVFTSIRKLNEPIDLGLPIWEIDELELSHRDYVVSVGFAALDFTAPHLNQYQYKLEGVQDEWITLDDPRATFAKLSPGRYTLKLRASNNEGLWNEEGPTLRLRVKPHFLRSTLAFLIYGLGFLGLVFLYARGQTRKLKQEELYSRQLEAKVRERTHELEEATVTDPLTGLKNRRYLMTTVADELNEVDRYNGARAEGEPARNVLFLMIDLDGLKQINDSFGHASGDRVITKMREILEGACRQTDTVVRMGGDEFLVVGRDVNRATAETLAERVRTNVETTVFDLDEEGEARLSCSIGFAFYPFVDDERGRVTGDQVVTIADRALYVAKTSGRNAWVGIHGTAHTLREDVSVALQSGLQSLVARNALIVGSSVHEGELIWGQEGS